jgi:Leucine-rich repeat (LRR) protein
VLDGKYLLFAHFFAHLIVVHHAHTKKHPFLAGNNLFGKLPPEIGSLSRLAMLDLENNRIAGPIPSELGKIVGLENLALQSNILTGTIPSELGHIQRLGQLMVQFNELTGTMPAKICALTPHTEDGGLLFNLESDCDPRGGLKCDCCNACCDGLNSCYNPSEGETSATTLGSTNSNSNQQYAKAPDYNPTNYYDEYDIEAMMLSEEADDYFDNYGY